MRSSSQTRRHSSERIGSLTEARKIVKECSGHYLARIDARGHLWVEHTLVPAVEKLSDSTRDRWLASGAWNLLGDLHFVHSAFASAARAYRRASRIDNSWPKPVLSLATTLDCLGESEKAITVYKRLIRGFAKSEAAVEAKGALDSPIARRSKSDARNHQRFTQAMDELASGHPQHVLRLMNGRRSVDAVRARCMAYGALGCSVRTLAEWQLLKKTRGPIFFGGGDLFYLPRLLWDTPDVWILLRSICGRIKNLGLVSCWGEKVDAFGPPELFRQQSRKMWRRIYAVSLEFHIARTKEDIIGLTRLRKEFPEWKECKYAVNYYRTTGFCPTHREVLYLSEPLQSKNCAP